MKTLTGVRFLDIIIVIGFVGVLISIIHPPKRKGDSVMIESGKVVQVEAREWLKRGNKIDFTNNPHFVGAEVTVEELYKLGAEKVEVSVYGEKRSTRSLFVTLPEDRDKAIDVLVCMLDLEIETPTRDGNEVRMYLNWDIDHSKETTAEYR